MNVWNISANDLEEAYSLLDPTRPSTQFERPTKYAAAALMSRVRLYQASKWYNGNQYYADWTTSRRTKHDSPAI